jgi:DNA-binding transcriptional LysR family regulator
MSVELKHLRAFVAVAEELNFTRAAERLHLAQQALSAQIRQLEERTGVQLLERTTRKVTLTPAGEALLEHARSVLAGTERAVAAVKAAGGETPRLTLGLVVPADYEPFRPALALFGERRPDVEVRVHFGEVPDPSGGLFGGDADVAIVVGAFTKTGLESVTLWTDPRGLAMSTDHELAAGADVSLEQMVAEPTFDFLTDDPIFRDYWMATNHRGGRPPRIVAQFRGLDGLLEGIRSGLGVNLIRERIVNALGPASGVVFRPVVNLEPADVAIAWRTGDKREIVSDFVSAACDAFDRTPPLPEAQPA